MRSERVKGQGIVYPLLATPQKEGASQFYAPLDSPLRHSCAGHAPLHVPKVTNGLCVQRPRDGDEAGKTVGTICSRQTRCW